MADLEFAVDNREGEEQIFESIDVAIAYAVRLGLADGLPHYVDVLTWTRAAAVAYGGDDAGDVYDEDPDASVFERIVIRAESQGRVP